MVAIWPYKRTRSGLGKLLHQEKNPLGVSTMRKTIIAAASALFIGGAGVATFAVPAFAATSVTSS
jgi:hypothetical protein